MSDGGRTAFGGSAAEEEEEEEEGGVRCTERVATPEPVDSGAASGEHADIINIAVVGPSGVGKTTLIQSFIVCCHLFPTASTSPPRSREQLWGGWQSRAEKKSVFLCSLTLSAHPSSSECGWQRW